MTVGMDKLTAGLLALAISMMAGLAHAHAKPGGVRMGAILNGGGSVTAGIHTWRAEKFRHVVRQRTDFSCGAASVATILKYAYHRSVTRKQVLHDMLGVSNSKKVRHRGFSMLDMKHYAQKIGFRGKGYRVKASKLKKLRLPVIVLLNLGGYQHFVVLRRVEHQRVFLADPALGNRTLSMKKFRHDWNNIIFALVGPRYKPHNALYQARPRVDTARVSRSILPKSETMREQLSLFTGFSPADRF